jgi:chemotaxis signal transduction protein
MELVTFAIQKNRFALAASSISQVLEPSAVTPLPYAPPDVEGLVNVSGSVLLQLNLALRLGMSAGPTHGSGNLVVVFTGHENIALQVDRVHNKINVDESLITRYAATEPRKLVCGEFALNDGVVLLLDAQALDMRALDPRGVPESGGGLMGFDLNDATRDGALQKTDVQIATITGEEGGEAYALEMSQVHEIVQMGPLTQLPGASFEVAGLMPLREALLLPRLPLD